MFRIAKARRPKAIVKAKSRAELEAERLSAAAARKMEPRIAAAFLAAIRTVIEQPGIARELRAALQNSDTARIEALIGADKIEDALRGAGMPPDRRTFEQELTAALVEGGTAGSVLLGPRRSILSGSLNMTNPAALEYLRSTVPSAIREIGAESMRAIQSIILRGFEDGNPTRVMARDIRNVIGLTQAQAQAVYNLRQQLETGQIVGTRADLRRLSAVERRQAEAMRRAAAAGEKAAQERIDAMVERYHQSLLNRRARNVARTESTRAFGEGQRALWAQAAERGLIDPARTRRRWLVTADDRLRESHAAVPGMNPEGVALDQPYDTPIGQVMAPRTSGNPGFDVNCLLPGNRVAGEFVAGLESFYSGEAVEIVYGTGKRLTVTPNHPILTAAGLKPAGSICEGEHLIADRSQVFDGATRAIEEKHEPTAIEQVFQALAESRGFLRPVSDLNLHGDEFFMQGDVRQVGADLELKGRYFTGFFEQVEKLALVSADIAQAFGGFVGASAQGFGGLSGPANGVMRSTDLFLALLLAHLRPFQPLGFGLVAQRDALLQKYPRHRMAGDAVLLAEFINRGASQIGLAEVVSVRRFPFSGHVYDLQSTTGWMIAEGVLISNCRCTEYLEFLD